MYKIISILTFLLFLSQINSFAETSNTTDFDLPDEEYVDDIPFNTKDIIGLDLDTNNGSNNPNEQNFVNKLMEVNTVMNVNFELEEEKYIDDIPFATEDVVSTDPIYMNSTLENLLSVEFNLEEEAYIDDIPFNTCDVIKGIRP